MIRLLLIALLLVLVGVLIGVLMSRRQGEASGFTIPAWFWFGLAAVLALCLVGLMLTDQASRAPIESVYKPAELQGSDIRTGRFESPESDNNSRKADD